MLLDSRSAKLAMGLILLSSVSCTDRIPTLVEPPVAASEHLNCLMDIDARRMSCVRASSDSGGGGGARVSPALLERLYDLNLRSTDVVYTPEDSTLRAMVDVTSYMITEPIGSPDGETVTGVKVFMEGGPYIALFRDSGDVADPWFRNQPVGPTGPAGATWMNPDGYANFTGPNQPYIEYLEILQPGQYSAKREWRFKVIPEAKLIGFRAKIFTSTTSETRVLLLPPDTIPTGLYDSANILLDSPEFGLARRVLKDIVSVRFHPTSTRDERQAAVDVVKGTLVGGQRFPGQEGYYLVRVPDDGTGQQLRAAIDWLNTLPQVAAATPEYLWLIEEFLQSAHPDDTDAWAGPWQRSRARADGRNFALESLSAPRAWGCSVGSSATRVAVIDVGYFSHRDLLENSSYIQAVDRYAGAVWTGTDHGTLVASLIGARGNNQSGITGMMWKADLQLYEASVTDDGDVNWVVNLEPDGWGEPMPVWKLTEYRFHQAVRSGASVINISLGWPAKAGSDPIERRIADAGLAASGLANSLIGSANKPLVVIGAGNSGADAFTGVVPMLAALVPDQALVVAGASPVADDQFRLWSHSNSNTALSSYDLVQIAAPGDQIWALGEQGIEQTGGTSMSAPLVSGIAGLLKSFDPRLTAAEIKNFLIEGSRRSARVIPMNDQSIVRMADAYESLKAAAERPGAPLCGGTPVWQALSGAITARRVAPLDVLLPAEALFSHAGSELVPMHADQSIRMDQSFHDWTPTGWREATTSRVDLFGNATNRSKLAQSHDGDSTVTVVRQELSDTTELYKVYVNGTLLTQVQSWWSRSPSANGCVRYDQYMNCLTGLQIWSRRTISSAAVAFSPSGDEVALAISRQESSQMTDTPVPCYGTGYCSDYSFEIKTLPAQVIFLGLSDGLIRGSFSVPNRNVKEFGLSEDGTRVVLRTLTYTYNREETIAGTYETKIEFCDASYRTRAGKLLFSLPLQHRVPTCYMNATFSP